MAKFVYNGPPQLIVALGRHVKDGDTVDGPDTLRHSAGFTPVEKAKPKAEKDGS